MTIDNIFQPIVIAGHEVNYDFLQLTPITHNVKDSFTFSYGGFTWVICTNVDQGPNGGGLTVFKEVNGILTFHANLFTGRYKMWAPRVVIEDDVLYVLVTDTQGTGNEPDWYNHMRAFKFQYAIFSPTNWCSNPGKIVVGDDSFGIIDVELFKIGEFYYLCYVIMDWHQGEWWDLWCSCANNWSGPFTSPNKVNFSGATEHGIEEAPCYNKDDGMFYFSVNDSATISSLRRGYLISSGINADGSQILNLSEDDMFRMQDVSGGLCTHPDFWKGKIRATGKGVHGYHIMEQII